jgi:hypothetical protein
MKRYIPLITMAGLLYPSTATPQPPSRAAQPGRGRLLREQPGGGPHQLQPAELQKRAVEALKQALNGERPGGGPHQLQPEELQKRAMEAWKQALNGERPEDGPHQLQPAAPFQQEGGEPTDVTRSLRGGQLEEAELQKWVVEALKEAEDAEKKAKDESEALKDERKARVEALKEVLKEAEDAEKKAKDESEALKGKRKPPKVRVTPELIARFFRNSEEARAHPAAARH